MEAKTLSVRRSRNEKSDDFSVRRRLAGENPFMAVWDTNKEAHLEGGREARVEGGPVGEAGSERERAAGSDPLTEGGETQGLWRVVKAWS